MHIQFIDDKDPSTKQAQTSIAISTNTNDVSFSIPEWKNQQLQSIHKDYEKKIYTAVPLSLTDFNTTDEIQFMSKPEKPQDQRYAYERKLYHPEDFSILAFILCFEQTMMGKLETKEEKIEKFKKKISDLDLCTFEEIPKRVRKHYNNEILKKILFQYINKGSYNVSLLEILLRKNYLLKFALSLVSKTILRNNNLMSKYADIVCCFVEMKVCGAYFDVIPDIAVKEKSIESENFYVSINGQEIFIYRKHNIILKESSKEEQETQRKSRRVITPTHQRVSSHRKSKNQQKGSKLSSKVTSIEQYFGPSDPRKKQTSKIKLKEDKLQRPSSVSHFFRKFICFG